MRRHDGRPGRPESRQQGVHHSYGPAADPAEAGQGGVHQHGLAWTKAQLGQVRGQGPDGDWNVGSCHCAALRHRASVAPTTCWGQPSRGRVPDYREGAAVA